MQYLITSLWVGVHRVVSVPLGGGAAWFSRGRGAWAAVPGKGVPDCRGSAAGRDAGPGPVVRWGGASRDPIQRSRCSGESGDDVDA